jgi:hypothetical protein
MSYVITEVPISCWVFASLGATTFYLLCAEIAYRFGNTLSLCIVKFEVCSELAPSLHAVISGNKNNALLVSDFYSLC